MEDRGHTPEPPKGPQIDDKQKLLYIYNWKLLIFNRPGVAGAVLQTPLSLIN